MGGALSLSLANYLLSSNPLNACVSFYGVPSHDISQIPLKTPVQAHFGALDNFKGFSDIATAERLAKEWEVTIKQHGGRHAEGLHKDEAEVFVYPNQGVSKILR